MHDPSPQPKTTPARRRQGRGGGRSAGQKAYASENDAGMLDMGQHQRAPQTPDKTGSRTPGPQSTQPGSKQRSRTKNKGKVNQTSPEGYQYGQSTPPPQQQRRASMKSNAVPAFAGATFHASPAPSALPIPSFLSKTSSESPLGRSVAQPSPPVTDNEAPTPTFSSSVPKSHESPLDFMFRAHKQEKARGSRDLSRNHDYRDYDSASPHPASASRPSTLPRNTPGSSGGIDRDELDGSHGLPIGPAFSTPYQERINAARASRNGANQPTGPSPSHQQHQQPSQDDPTEALKRYLFGGGSSQDNAVQSPPAVPPPQQYHHHHPQHQYQPQYQQPQQQTPVVAADGRSSNIHAMENDLRRILKLDMGSDSSTTSNQRWFS